MTKKKLVPIVGMGICVLFIAVTFSWLHSRTASFPKPFDPQQYKAIMIAEEVAATGKLVEARYDGKTIGSYMCTPQDAAVMWVVKPNDGSELGMAPLFAAHYSDGRPLKSITTRIGNACLVRILRGFDKPLEKAVVTVPICPPEGGVENIDFAIPEIAKPERVLPVLSKEEQKAVDKIAIATFDPKNNFLTIQPSKPYQRDEFGIRTVLSTSYFPGGQEPPDLGSFGRFTDTIQVRLDRYKYKTEYFDLTYHDAQIAVVNNKRTLRLPNTQLVGKVLDYPASINKLIPIPKQNSAKHSSHGELFVRLQTNPSAKIQPIRARAFIDSISPSLQTMGLDVLLFRLEGTDGIRGFQTELTSAANQKTVSPNTIPSLKIRIRLRHPYLESSQVLTMPLRHGNIVPNASSQTVFP